MIHTHSKSALLVTLLYPGKEFRLSHLEMIKVGIGTSSMIITIVSIVIHFIPGYQKSTIKSMLQLRRRNRHTNY